MWLSLLGSSLSVNEESKVKKSGRREKDVSWDSMIDGCIRRLKVDPLFLGGGERGIVTQECIMLYKISIFFYDSQIYVICQN